jgi:leader peptidase (prepilin peptidase) / N-methyltransferase
MTDPRSVALAAFLAAYAAILVIDLRTGLIPNVITYPAIVAALVLRPDGVGVSPAYALTGAVIGAAFLAMWSRGWMGMGDVKLALLIGLVSGPPLAFVGLWVGFVSGGLVSIALLVTGRKRRRDAVPFGPFLAVGGACVLVFRDQLGTLPLWLGR